MSKKSLFDDVPEPIFKEGDEQEEEQLPVATEEQPDVPEIPDDDSFEDIGQQPDPTITRLDSFDFRTSWGGNSYANGQARGNIVFSRAVSSFPGVTVDAISADGTIYSNWGIGGEYHRSLPSAFWSVRVSPPGNINGQFRLRFRLGNSSFTSNLLSIDNRLTYTWSIQPTFNLNVNPPNGQVTARITTSRAISLDALHSSDFEIRNATNTMAVTGWSISISVVNNITHAITANPPNNTGDTFRLRLKRSAFNVNAPPNNIDSALFATDNRIVATWTSISYCSGSGTTGRVSANLSFNKNVTGLTTSDIVFPAAWTNLTITGSGRSYTVTIDPQANISGRFRLTLNANAVTDSSDNTITGPSASQSSDLVDVDNRGNQGRPAIIIDTGIYNSFNQKISWVVYITNATNAQISALNSADITLNGAPAGVGIESVTRLASGGSYRVTTQPVGSNQSGSAAITIRSNALGTNSNLSTTSGCVQYNSITLVSDVPVISLSIGSFCPTSRKITWTVLVRNATATQFSALDTTDISITDSSTASPALTETITNRSTNSFTVEILVPTGRTGNASITIRANALGTNTNEAITSAAIAYDTTEIPSDEPLVATWSNMVGGPTITGTLTFGGQDVSNISASDFELRTVLGRATAVTITVSASSASAGQSITVTATPSATYKIDGELFLRLKQDSLTVGTGTGPNEHIDSNLVELNTFTVWGDPTGGTTLSATMTFGSDLTRIATSDFDVIDQANEAQTGWTIELTPDVTTRNNGESLVVTATPPANTADIFRLRLNAQTLRAASGSTDTVPKIAVITTGARVNNIDSTQVVPQVIIGTGAFCPTSRKITWPVSVVNADVMQFGNLDEADITITDSSTATPALTETIVSRGANSFIVEITVPTERNGTASITVAANALGPSTNVEVTSNDVAYDTRTALTATTITYGTPVPDNPGRDIEFPVTFSDIGDGLTGDDFTVNADNGIWGVTIRDGTGGANTKVIVVTNTEPYARMGNMTITIDEDAFTNRSLPSSESDRTSPSAAYNLESTITETTVDYISLPGYGSQNFVVTNNNRTIEFRLRFSNIGAGLEPNDFTVNATNGTWVVSLEHEGSNTVRVTVTETGSSSISGSLTITIDEDAFFNRQITGNRVSPTATYALTTSTTLPSVDINLDRTGPIRLGEEFAIFFTWDRDVTTFDDYDVRISYGFDLGGIRATNRRFFGSGRAYRLTLSVIRTDADLTGGFINVSISANALDGGNVPAFLRIPIGYSEITPTLLTANEIAGDGLAYTPQAIYTIGQDEADTVARLRSYNESGVLQTNNLVTTGEAIDKGQERHARSIDILDNRFLISARYFGTFGITRATGYVEDSRTFNKLFIDSGDYVNSFEVTHSIQDPIEDARLRNHPDPDARIGNERVLARVPARAIQRRNEFVTRQFTTQRVATDTAVQAIAVGPNRIYLLTSGGSVSEPQYDIQIYDLFGGLITSFSVDTNTENRKEFGAVPISLGVTSRFLYLGFASFEDPLTGTTVTAPDLYAYTLDGDRIPSEDLKLVIGQGAGQQDWYYGVISMDWNETDERMWMIVRRVRKLDAVTEQWFGYFDLPYPIDPKWSAIKPQTLESGETFDLKPHAGNISTISFAAGVAVPSWLSLSNGVITVASSGLPSTNETHRVSFIGIGSGRPAYVSFDLTLLREAPTWRNI